MDSFLVTTTPVSSEQSATAVPVEQTELLAEAMVGASANPGPSGGELALTIDVTTIATVGIVLAFSYGIVKTFRDQ